MARLLVIPRHGNRSALCAAHDTLRVSPESITTAGSMDSGPAPRGASTPTLFIGGANSKGALFLVLHTLAAHVKGSKTAMISGTTHPMFDRRRSDFARSCWSFWRGRKGAARP
jgi:hypothetical protein